MRPESFGYSGRLRDTQSVAVRDSRFSQAREKVRPTDFHASSWLFPFLEEQVHP